MTQTIEHTKKSVSGIWSMFRLALYATVFTAIMYLGDFLNIMQKVNPMITWVRNFIGF